MPSFDIQSIVDIQEVDNAVNATAKEISSRFDFRSGKSKLELDKTNKSISILADDELKLRAIHQILETKLAKRGIDCRSLNYEKEEVGSMGILKQKATLKTGLSKEEAKKINQFIKDTKLKVQSQIQDDEVRVTGKKIDDLQDLIAKLKTSELGLPLQFVNMRS